jgi:hypothetical protein
LSQAISAIVASNTALHSVQATLRQSSLDTKADEIAALIREFMKAQK